MHNIIAYHGSNVKFDQFDPSTIGNNNDVNANGNFNNDKDGFFFTSSADEARGSANVVTKQKHGTPIVYKCRLTYNNPYTLNTLMNDIGDDKMESIYNSCGGSAWGIFDNHRELIISYAKQHECDSIVFKSNGLGFYVMFNINQIDIIDSETFDIKLNFIETQKSQSMNESKFIQFLKKLDIDGILLEAITSGYSACFESANNKLTLYRGESKDIDRFDINDNIASSLGKGIYLTDSIDLAKAYASKYIYKTTVTLSNPLVFNWRSQDGKSESIELGNQLGIDVDPPNWINGDGGDNTTTMEQHGYDGLIVHQPQTDNYPEHIEVVVFNPSNIHIESKIELPLLTEAINSWDPNVSPITPYSNPAGEPMGSWKNIMKSVPGGGIGAGGSDAGGASYRYGESLPGATRNIAQETDEQWEDAPHFPKIIKKSNQDQDTKRRIAKANEHIPTGAETNGEQINYYTNMDHMGMYDMNNTKQGAPIGSTGV